MIPLNHYLVIGACLFAIGVFGALSRRNAIWILMSIELIFNAANINLVAFQKYGQIPDGLGHIFALFVITIAAASAVVGLVLVIAIYRNMRTIFLDKVNLMKW